MPNANKYQFNADEALENIYRMGLFKDGSNGFIQTLINEQLEIASNSFFWQELFTVEGQEYPANLGKLKEPATWAVRSRNPRLVPMADAMNPLSDVAQLDSEGFEAKTGLIFQYGKGLYDTSMSKIALQDKLKELSVTDQNLLQGYVRGVGDLTKSLNYRLSNMAAQVLSKGGAYGNSTTKGMSGVIVSQPSYIPADNFVKAGTKVWNDSSCDIPTQMQKIEYDFKIANSLPEDTPFEWDLPYDMVVNVILKNAKFLEQVNLFIRSSDSQNGGVVVIKSDGTSAIDQSIVTVDQLVQYSRWSMSKISPIRVMKESQSVQGISSTSTVKGWSDGVAVLHPLGNAGVIVHALPPDVEMNESGELNDSVAVSMAQVQNFLYLINKTVPNGSYKAYHTDLIGCFAPVLTDVPYHVVVDTTTAL